MIDAYEKIVQRGARVMAQILNVTGKRTTTMHCIAEPGLLEADLLVKIQQSVNRRPDQDAVIYIQRVDLEVINNHFKKGQN